MAQRDMPLKSPRRLLTAVATGSEGIPRPDTAYNLLWETTTDVVVLLDDRGCILYVNPAINDVFGYTQSELVSRSIATIQPEQLREAHAEGMRGYLKTGKRKLDWRSVETMGLHRDGHEFPIEINFSDMLVDGRRVFAGFIRDITARKNAQTALSDSEQRFRHLAHFDALTGLPNRTFLCEHLAECLNRPLPERPALSLLLLDLDSFKNVNDGIGHGAGDLLLCEVGRRLQQCVRDGDVVARLGGDEFAVILRNSGDKGRAAEQMAARILKVIEWPCRLQGDEITMSTSIGIALAPRDSTDADTLLKYAETAMYAAKDKGRNGLCFYTPEMNQRVIRRRSLEAALRRAIDTDQFELHFQPQCSAKTKRCVGLEALLRWNSPEDGLVSPADFMSVLEETGLIVPVGRWVIRRACQHIAAWRAAGLPIVPIAVNVSARQFRDRELALDIEFALQDYEVSPSLLEVEITETTMMSSLADTDLILGRLKVLGVGISIDDFGTGYSSLAYLKRFPIDTLKIDTAFVRDIATDPDDAAIVMAIISMAHTLKLNVVAEGVETAGQAEFLSTNGCDYLQGYFISGPLSPVDTVAYLSCNSDQHSIRT